MIVCSDTGAFITGEKIGGTMSHPLWRSFFWYLHPSSQLADGNLFHYLCQLCLVTTYQALRRTAARDSCSSRTANGSRDGARRQAIKPGALRVRRARLPFDLRGCSSALFCQPLVPAKRPLVDFSSKGLTSVACSLRNVYAACAGVHQLTLTCRSIGNES